MTDIAEKFLQISRFVGRAACCRIIYTLQYKSIRLIKSGSPSQHSGHFSVCFGICRSRHDAGYFIMYNI